MHTILHKEKDGTTQCIVGRCTKSRLINSCKQTRWRSAEESTEVVPFSCVVAGCGHKSWKNKTEILFFPKRGTIKAKMDKSSKFRTQELQAEIEQMSM